MFETESLIFENRLVFSNKYIPDKIVHREQQIEEVQARLQWPLMKNPSKPKDHVIYGFGGTGKTLISRHVVDELMKRTPDVTYFYISLKDAHTLVRALNAILAKMGGKAGKTNSSQHLFEKIYACVNTLPQKYVIFILDEIDKVVDGYDDLLYGFLRSNEKASTEKEITLIATSNDFNFPSGLEMGTRSSFSLMDKLTFPMYNAPQLKDILANRAVLGLKKGTYDDAILSLCAAHGARDHGDARKTIELLEKSAEITMARKDAKITHEHIELALKQSEYEGVYYGLKTLPIQSKAVALSCIRDRKRILKSKQQKSGESTTNTAYSEYTNICHRLSISSLSLRRFSDIINDLAFLGMLNNTITYTKTANVPSRGKKKLIEITISLERAEEIITGDEVFSSFKPEIVQTKLDLSMMEK
jgi:archaeal cell division control protein 6